VSWCITIKGRNLMVKPKYMIKILLCYWNATIRVCNLPLSVVFRNKFDAPAKGPGGFHYFYKLLVVSCYHGASRICVV